MGTDKALLEFDGRPLVSHIVDRLATVSDDVFVVAKQSLPIEIPEVLDEFAEQTPLSGVITALHSARHPLVFVCACDMPFVSVDLVTRLADACLRVDAVVPAHDERIEPLHAVWSVASAPKLEAIWDDGERAVHRALTRLDVTFVDVEDTAPFTNVNTPEDLAAIRPAPSEPRPSSDRR